MRNDYTGWAVLWGPKLSKEEPFLVGRYWFQDGDAPSSRDGHSLALFKTRKAARDAVKPKQNWFGRYKIVRASVQMTVI